MSTNKDLTEKDIAKVAAEAGLDPRTVERVVIELQQPRSEATRSAIVRALRKYGHSERAKRIEGGR